MGILDSKNLLTSPEELKQKNSTKKKATAKGTKKKTTKPAGQFKLTDRKKNSASAGKPAVLLRSLLSRFLCRSFSSHG